MAKASNFKSDPLYRVIDIPDEVKSIEGRYKKIFDRLKFINSLGIIPEVLEMAKYPKYEHHMGAIHQISCLLDCDKGIDKKYHQPLTLSALFLHVGHFPFTNSSEKALLIASHLITNNKDNKAKKYIKSKIDSILIHHILSSEEENAHKEYIQSVQNYRRIHRYISCSVFLSMWRNIKNILNLDEEHKKNIVRNLIDFKSVGYGYLELADKADFVQRDALYFGSVRFDVSPHHLYGESYLSEQAELSFYDERTLLDINFDFLKERFYENWEVTWVSRLYEKIVAFLILSENFKMEWLEEFNDTEFKKIIIENRLPDSSSAKLPRNWIIKGKKLFEKDIQFSNVFELPNVPFEETKNIIDLECELLGINKNNKNLLSYPFEKGLLIDIKRASTEYSSPGYRDFSLRIFQDNSKIKFIELLKLIRQISYHCPIQYIDKIRKGIGSKFSWTGSCRINNADIIKSISEVIEEINNKGELVTNFLQSVTTYYKDYQTLWNHMANSFWILRNMRNFEKDKKVDIASLSFFVSGMLSLPVQLLQFQRMRKLLDSMYDEIIKMLCGSYSKEKKGVSI